MNYPLVIALGGYSESGKSSSGRYFSTRGFARVKIATLYKKIYEQVDTDLSFVDWSSWIDANDPKWIGRRFAEELCAELRGLSKDCCTIESLYGDVLARELKVIFGERFKVVFIDLDFDTRLARQMEREGFSSIEDARSFITPRDEMKRRWGADKVRELADVVVRNDGTLAQLHERLEGIISAEHSKR